MLKRSLGAASFDACKVEQRVDELEEPQLVPLHECQRLAFERSLRRAEGVVRRTHDQRQRRAQLVAHVGEEGGLGAIERLELLGAPARGFEGARVANRGRHLQGNQLEESLIAVIQHAMGAHAADEQAVGVGLIGRSKRKHDRRARPLRMRARAAAGRRAASSLPRCAALGGSCSGQRRRRRLRLSTSIGWAAAWSPAKPTLAARRACVPSWSRR